MTKIVVFQHVPAEGPAAIAGWAAARGHDLAMHRWWCDGERPPPAAALVVLGGPMNVDDRSEHPWLSAERRAIAAALGAGIPVLGICLGAQLIAVAAGARVRRNPVAEIGWLPVERVAEHPLIEALPAAFTPLHWHGDTFDLPPEAILLHRSEHCAHQSFALGARVLGLQYHLEQDERGLSALIAAECHEAAAPPAVQSAAAIRAGWPIHGRPLAPRFAAVLDRWLAI